MPAGARRIIDATQPRSQHVRKQEILCLCWQRPLIESRLVRVSRHLLLAVVVYVALDLSLPAMPGAFVFDADTSVETVHSGQGRIAAAVVSAPIDCCALLVGNVMIAARPARITAAAERPCRVPIGCFARAALSLSSAPSVSDPH